MTRDPPSSTGPLWNQITQPSRKQISELTSFKKDFAFERSSCHLDINSGKIVDQLLSISSTVMPSNKHRI